MERIKTALLQSIALCRMMTDERINDDSGELRECLDQTERDASAAYDLLAIDTLN